MDARPSPLQPRLGASRLATPASAIDAVPRTALCGAGQGPMPSAGTTSGGSPATGASTCPSSASEWITIFATWFARRKPGLSAEEVLTLAIDEFKRSHSVPPETAAERYGE